MGLADLCVPRECVLHSSKDAMMPPPGSATAARLYPQVFEVKSCSTLCSTVYIRDIFIFENKENEYNQLLRHIKLAWNGSVEVCVSRGTTKEPQLTESEFKVLFFNFIYFKVYGCFACLYVCPPCVCSAHRGGCQIL